MIALQFGLSLVFFVLFIGYFLTSDSRRRMRLSLALTASLVALCLSSLFMKGEDGQWKIKIKPGLDLKGGTQFLLELAGDVHAHPYARGLGETPAAASPRPRLRSAGPVGG